MHPLTKFRAPAAGARTVVRDDLLTLLDGDEGVAVLRAPAGYGKTTVVAQWLEAVPDRRAVWVSLDEDDDDPAGLWGAIRAAAEAAGLPVQEGGGGPVRDGILLPLLGAFSASGDRWILVLDDMHLIAHEGTLASLDWFLAQRPANLTIVLATRAPVELPTADRLRAQNRILDIGPRELALALDRTAEVLHRAFGLGPEDATRVHAATDGWPAAVSMLGSALSRGVVPAGLRSHRFADLDGIRALIAEGLAVGDPGDADLLRRMSVLERFDAGILAAVVQDERAWGVAMGVAERTGLIAALDGRRQWWRMHHLVRELLQDALERTDPALRRELHRRAFLAFERENDITATVQHLLDAEDYDTLGDILVNVRASSMVPRQALGLGWLDRIPPAALDRDPRLAFWEAWATATGGDQERRDRALARGRMVAAARSIDAFRTWDDVEDFVLSSACYGDVGSSRRSAERFLRSYDAEHPLAQLVESRLATMLYLEGRCDEALQVLDQLDGGPPLARPLRLLVPAYRALCELERGDPKRAGIFVDRCAQARADYMLGPDLTYLPAEQALARLQTLRGDASGGLATALAALDVARPSPGDPVLVVPHLLVEVARARFALGSSAEASVALSQAEELIADATDAGALPHRIAAMRAEFELPRTVTAHASLTRRELDVLALLPTRLSSAAIAAELFVSANTARTHVKAIHRKLGVTSREEAVVAARNAGLLVPGDTR